MKQIKYITQLIRRKIKTLRDLMSFISNEKKTIIIISILKI